MPDGNGNPPSSNVTVPVTPTLAGTPIATPIPLNSNELEVQDPNAKGVDYWKRDRDRVRGSWMAERSQWDQVRGQLEAQAKQTSTQAQDLQSQLAALTAERDQMKQTVEQLPTLQQRAADADTYESKIERLETVLQRGAPIIAQSTTEVVKAEDGTESTVISNPFLDLVLSSAATGDAFKTILDQVVARLPNVGTGAAAPPPNPLDMTTTPPAPPSPIGDQLAQLRQARDEAHDAGDRDTLSDLNMQIVKLQEEQQKK